jgi:hypothetical protein
MRRLVLVEADKAGNLRSGNFRDDHLGIEVYGLRRGDPFYTPTP